MRCVEMMKRPVRVLRSDETIRDAAFKMREHDVGFLPVCDADGVVVGILTDRDVVLRVCATDRHPRTTLVRDVMSPGVIACRKNQTLRHAEGLMRRHRISRIVVVDEQGAACGIISLSDVVQYETPTRAAQALYDIASRKYGSEGGGP